MVFQRSTFVWQTKEGKRLPLSQIDDAHLQNIINFLQREQSLLRKQMREDIVWAASSSFDDELSILEGTIKFLKREQELRLAGL